MGPRKSRHFHLSTHQLNCVLIATTYTRIATHPSPSFERQSSPRVSRKSRACWKCVVPWTLFFDIGPSLGSSSCDTVCGLASAKTVFSMAHLRWSLFCPGPNGHLHVDPRAKRRTIVKTGRGPHTSTLSSNIMASPSCPDHDATNCAPNLFPDEILRARHSGRRCNAQVITVGDGHGTGQSMPFYSLGFSDSG